ncbi:MAG: hypothetical protein KGK33_14330 [Hyphomicrobiales bacterium]|nr:hypothetical protein [Hyphomicrobiales bacterium]MDE1974359.1 hypothetical protein [Hyphomicrobiales bacterium]MDE2285784.1 hypothetical protein [Hyphomicrobiales bacterium]
MMSKDDWGNLIEDVRDRVQNVLNEFKNHRTATVAAKEWFPMDLETWERLRTDIVTTCDDLARILAEAEPKPVPGQPDPR